MRVADSLPDLYGALGVEPGTNAEGIVVAYRNAARRAHPDSGGSHEEFIAVDLAWRLLRDPDIRRRFDALWRLQVAVESSELTSLSAARRLLDDADSVVVGWRIPVDIRTGVDGLLKKSRQWARKIAEASSPERTFDDRPTPGPTRAEQEQWRRETEDMVRQSVERHIAYFRDAAMKSMTKWPHVMDSTWPGGTLKSRRAGLADGYRIYKTLRNLQDTLDDGRRGAHLTADDLRLYFHVCDAVIDVRATLLDVQADLGRSYSFKNEKWLIDCRRRAQRALDDRRLTAGDPPWHAPSRSWSPHPHDTSETAPPGSADGRASPGASKPAGGNGQGRARSSDQPYSEDGTSDVSRHIDGRSRQARFVRLICVGAVAVVCVVGLWLARHQVVDVMSIVLGVAVLALFAGLAWAVLSSEEMRRVLGMVLLGAAKLTWLVLRGFAAVTIGLIGLVSRRR